MLFPTEYTSVINADFFFYKYYILFSLKVRFRDGFEGFCTPWIGSPSKKETLLTTPKMCYPEALQPCASQSLQLLLPWRWFHIGPVLSFAKSRAFFLNLMRHEARTGWSGWKNRRSERNKRSYFLFFSNATKCKIEECCPGCPWKWFMWLNDWTHHWSSSY